MNGEHGHRSEDILKKICFRMFGAELVLQSPVVIEQSGSKEVADILVLVDDTLLIIQSKSMDIDISDLDETDFGRIRKRHTKAKKQLNTLLNAAKRNGEVRGSTSLGVEIMLDWSLVQHRIGIVTLNLPDEMYENPEFRFQYPELFSEQRELDVHSFVLHDLWNASVELTTPGDVLLYLKVRKQCFTTDKFLIGNELDFLALYKTDYPQIEQALTDPDFHICLAPGIWEEFRNGRTQELKDRDERYRSSYIIDDLISDLRSAFEYSIDAQGLTAQESALGYLGVVGKLGKLPRMERARIGDKILTKEEETKIKEYGYFAYVSIHFRIGYFFLLWNESDQEKRRQLLKFLAEGVCHKIEDDKATQFVAIVTDRVKSHESSIDARIFDVMHVKEHTEPPDKKLMLFGNINMERIDEWS